MARFEGWYLAEKSPHWWRKHPLLTLDRLRKHFLQPLSDNQIFARLQHPHAHHDALVVGRNSRRCRSRGARRRVQFDARCSAAQLRHHFPRRNLHLRLGTPPPRAGAAAYTPSPASPAAAGRAYPVGPPPRESEFRTPSRTQPTHHRSASSRSESHCATAPFPCRII